ncbi:MAG: MMPL family transporter, partial [Myxococcota bacterium]
STDYVGVAELGSIAGAGMFVSLFTNLTLLPALIAWWVPTGSVALPPAASERLEKLLQLPVQHARAVVAAALLCTGIAAGSIPYIRFDPNPLRVRDPSTTSVRLFDEILESGDALPWNLNALAADPAMARALAARIESLPDVDRALTLDDYVPEHQKEKLALLEEAAFVLLPTLEAPRSRSLPDSGAQLAAVAALQASLEVLPDSGASPRLIESAGRLHESLQRLRERWTSTREGAAALANFESSLIGSLPEQLRVLQEALQPTLVTRENLPDSVTQRMTATDGRARVEIFPEKNLNDPEALENYVRSVQGLAPEAFGEGLVILETGAVVVDALRQALVVAALSISLLLLCLWRNIGDALLVVAPLGLATLFTAATSVPLGVPFNFANVIVIPLLLGMGVDTGIHLVHRYRSEALPGGNLLRTGTARAVLLSSLTTVASFGTLALSTHLGMASLGQLLALGFGLILLCNLVVLPALVQVTGRGQ